MRIRPSRPEAIHVQIGPGTYNRVELTMTVRITRLVGPVVIAMVDRDGKPL